MAHGEPNQNIHPLPSQLQPSPRKLSADTAAEQRTQHSFTSADWKPKGKLNTSRLVKILQPTAQMWCYTMAYSITWRKFQRTGKKKENKKEKSSLHRKLPMAVWGGNSVFLRTQALFYKANSSQEHTLGRGKRNTKESGCFICFLSQTASLDVCITGTTTLPSSKKEVLQIFLSCSGWHSTGA